MLKNINYRFGHPILKVFRFGLSILFLHLKNVETKVEIKFSIYVIIISRVLITPHHQIICQRHLKYVKPQI